MCRATKIAGWNLELAAKLLGGDEMRLQARAKKRLVLHVRSVLRELEKSTPDALKVGYRSQGLTHIFREEFLEAVLHNWISGHDAIGAISEANNDPETDEP